MSTYYQSRMEADLERIRAKVRKVSDLVESQVERAVRALLEDDRRMASQVVLGDRQVNRRIKQIDNLCHAFIVRHAPSEAFLRRASAVLRLDVALERVGDYADAIGREAGHLSGPLPPTVAEDFQAMAEQARASLARALRAFHEGDAELARATNGHVERVNATFDRLYAALLREADKGESPLHDVFGFLHVLNLLERVLEQSENIREQTLFAFTGELPPARVFRVLFVDERNDGASQIAEAYARGAFSGSGIYSSGGWRPADALDSRIAEIMRAKGLDVEHARPKALQPISDGPDRVNVVVSMAPEGEKHVGPVPFRTTVVTWNVGSADDVEALYQGVTERVRDLMHTLSGPDAS